MVYSRRILLIVQFALLCGLAYRLHPIFLGQPNLSETFMTEDGYLMLTIARNMAIGLGMTVSDGTIATNGVQPLATFIFMLPYLVTGGDKVTSLIGIHLIHAAAATTGVFAVRALASRLLGTLDKAALWPWLVATLWFLGPLVVFHSMNGLETGIYTLVLVVTLLQFARVLDRGDTTTLVDRMTLGALCGLAFLSRNDAVFLVIIIFSVWALQDWFRNGAGFSGMLGNLIPPGLLCLTIVAPWLVNNHIRFGSIVPISGSAQSMTATFGQNVSLLPVRVFEYLFPMLPVPGSIETHSLTIWAFTAISTLVIGIFLVRVARLGNQVVTAITATYVLHGVALLIYYGFFFGAPHFLSRYMAPLAPLLIIATMWVMLDLAPHRSKLPALAYGLCGIAISILLLARLLVPGVHPQGHMQVVRWVTENVTPTSWVGAVQTGTLGYWHDRTINLDGKVNPEALAIRRAEGDVLRYIADSDIDYVVDWVGMADWSKSSRGGFSKTFQLIVSDEAKNLAVLRRRELRQP